MSNKLFDRKCDVYRHNYDVQKCKMTLQKSVKCLSSYVPENINEITIKIMKQKDCSSN